VLRSCRNQRSEPSYMFTITILIWCCICLFTLIRWIKLRTYFPNAQALCLWRTMQMVHSPSTNWGSIIMASITLNCVSAQLYRNPTTRRLRHREMTHVWEQAARFALLVPSELRIPHCLYYFWPVNNRSNGEVVVLMVKRVNDWNRKNAYLHRFQVSLVYDTMYSIEICIPLRKHGVPDYKVSQSLRVATPRTVRPTKTSKPKLIGRSETMYYGSRFWFATMSRQFVWWSLTVIDPQLKWKAPKLKQTPWTFNITMVYVTPSLEASTFAIKSRDGTQRDKSSIGYHE